MNRHGGLICQDVAKRFPPDGRGLKGATLQVSPGEAYALLGANGAGKTTLLNLCLGFLRPDAGEIWIGGHTLAQNPVEAKRSLAYVPEVTRLYGHLSALENMAFFGGLLGRRHARAECMELLATLAFPAEAVAHPVGTYSKGMRQKVSLAIGLQKGAPVFLLDEPTSGLDPKSAHDCLEVMKNLTRNGKAVLFTTHHLGAIQRGADRVGVLRDGLLVREESASRFQESDLKDVYE